jgi:iron complex transport system substrate-binding protein
MPVALTEDRAAVTDSTRREFVIGAAALSALLFAGCGGDDGPGVGTATVDDVFGATAIPAAPRRVVADSVSTYAQLMSLGITPVAVAIPNGISADYISEDAGRMTNVVAEDGWTVDVEHALTLQPDLILAVGADYNRENCDRYRAAVATYCFAEVSTTGSDQDIKDTLVGIAMALGREEEAAAAIAAYDERVGRLRSRVAATDLGAKRIGIVRIDAGGFIGIRTGHTGNTILASLGLHEPDWPAATVDGYVELSLETLEVLDRADVLFVNTDDDVVIDESVVFQSPLWSRLAVVRDDRVEFVGAWNGADLPQLQRILDDIEETLIVPAESGR